jgi:hypothetical protein
MNWHPDARGQIHSDQTGKFVIASSARNNYVLVVYNNNSNSILEKPMRSRTGPCMLTAFQVLHTRLVNAGLRTQLHQLDNKCTAALKSFLRASDINFQLVPTGLHRRNAAESAIRTFKNHFIAGMCSVDKNFPLYLWDKLLPQAKLTLKLVCGSRLNPKLSAHAQLMAHSISITLHWPPGIRVLVHIKPADRTIWSPAHGADGWCIGPALNSYHLLLRLALGKTSTRICDTLTWFPTQPTMPLISSNDLIRCAPCSITDTSTSNMASAQQDALPTTSSLPSSNLTDTHRAR